MNRSKLLESFVLGHYLWETNQILTYVWWIRCIWVKVKVQNYVSIKFWAHFCCLPFNVNCQLAKILLYLTPKSVSSITNPLRWQLSLCIHGASFIFWAWYYCWKFMHAWNDRFLAQLYKLTLWDCDLLVYSLSVLNFE